MEMPGLRGFSATAIKRMRTFFEEWTAAFNRPLAAGDLAGSNENIDCKALINRPLLVADLDIHDFLSISFTHHSEILAKVKALEERIFYIKQAAYNSWPKDKLVEEIKADLYHHQSQIPNNFMQTMPTRVRALKAIEMFKDNYLLDFVNMEELGARDEQDIDERIVEQRIVHNVKNFIMTFGTDFTFVGNQYHLEKFGIEQFPDLLFYNRELSALVCVELKFGDFKPAYLGQLSAYLRILDTEVKKPHENPSIGIVLCKSANKAFVEFLIQGYDNPMGVATYKTKEDVRKLLPSEDELQKLLE
jgi:predicted nuclease of restriction endonuclease-like (RecB) superfamily